MIVYRPAVRSDLSQVLDLLREIMRHHDYLPPDANRLERTISDIIDSPDHLLLVAEDKESVIGMCALIFSISTWSASPVCELQDVVVTQGRRQAAVGKGLIGAAEGIARARGCARLFLLAEYWNLEAHAFYRSLGLKEKTCLYFERDLGTDSAQEGRHV
jgi:N-acetylglutamate synthase-like GNAT family acetyltransferase